MALYAESATDKADFDSHTRCKRAVELMLTSRGNPSVEVDRVLADDPQFVFAHCLRAAIIVRGDHDAARSKLVASVTAIETNCSDIDDPARRHAYPKRTSASIACCSSEAGFSPFQHANVSGYNSLS